MASKLDFEYEKIIKFCSLERRTTSIARTRANSSAVKILMLFGSLTAYVCEQLLQLLYPPLLNLPWVRP